MRKALWIIAAVLILITGVVPSAQANTVFQFDGFPTGPFSSGADNGFSVSSVNGYVWGNTYGFPGNSAGTGFPDTAATFTFTDGGTFTFLSLDLDNPGFGGTLTAVTVDGYLGAALVAADSFDVPSASKTPTTFDAVNLAGLDINSLVVTVTSNTAESPLLDNVTFTGTGVPEPAAIWMLSLGIGGILGFRCKRKNAA
ncbi:MAG TPA: PEP-CTERM sorting domain-containing protein [Candidatus Acidoferrales bacterium]|nr:PEP-CTERM sorting domain-containing protein [Candidatus Acidoferrales bacterium]